MVDPVAVVLAVSAAAALSLAVLPDGPTSVYRRLRRNPRGTAVCPTCTAFAPAAADRDGGIVLTEHGDCPGRGARPAWIRPASAAAILADAQEHPVRDRPTPPAQRPHAAVVAHAHYLGPRLRRRRTPPVSPTAPTRPCAPRATSPR